MPRVSGSQPTPLKIQLAIQGGGAKLCLLLAALEALETFRDDQRIEVTRIAGTSAGAIAGSLFAAGISMKVVRARLQGVSASQLRRAFPPITPLKAGMRVLRNEPFWSNNVLRDLLHRFFADVRCFKLQDIENLTGTKLIIVASDLTNARSHIYRDGEQEIVTALLDSCAIPFYFRSASGSHIVDGGICENLPSEMLEGDPSHGIVVGVSFQQEPGKAPESAGELAAALLETAIGNSMNRARRRLGDDRILSLRCSFGTFDLEKARAQGLGTDYELAKRDAEKFFGELIERERKRERAIIGDPWAEESVPMMRRMLKMYERQHADSRFRHLASRFVITANCLVPEGDARHGQPDLVKHVMEFEPVEPIYCHRISLAYDPAATFVGKTTYKTLDRDLKEVETVAFPLLGEDGKERFLLLCFDPVLRSESGRGPYRLHILQLMHDSISFANGKKDSIGFESERADGPIRRVDLVLFVPAGYRSLLLKQSEASAPGTLMTEQELNEYEPPPGFLALGWSGRGVPPRTPFSVDVIPA